MTRALALLLTISATLAASALAASSAAFPNRIELPDGFRPEGIATAGQRFFTGSLANGAIYSGSLRTGQGALLVQPQAGRVAVGMKADRGRLFVAGGNTGMAFVYNAKTGQNLASYQLSTGGSFINDVVVTKDAAWFTDSFKPVLYRVPLGPGGRPGAPSSFQTVPLVGRLPAPDGVQRERHRRDREREDARHRPVRHGHGCSPSRPPAWRRPSRSRTARACRTATASCSTGGRSTSSRTS